MIGPQFDEAPPLPTVTGGAGIADQWATPAPVPGLQAAAAPVEEPMGAPWTPADPGGLQSAMVDTSDEQALAREQQQAAEQQAFESNVGSIVQWGKDLAGSLTPDQAEQGAPPSPPAGAGSPPRPGALDLVGGMGQGIADRRAQVLAALETPLKRISVANPLAPIVQRQLAEWSGQGLPPIPAFEPEPLEVDPELAAAMMPEAIAELEAADLEMQREEYAGNVREILEAYQQIGDPRTIGTDGRIGFSEAERLGLEGVGDAEIGQAEAVADTMGATNAETRETLAQVRQHQLDNREWARAQMGAVEVLKNAENDARKALAEAPPMDPSRYFDSMEGGQKFWAILGGLAGGWNGSSSVPDMLVDMAAKDLAAQKEDYARLQDQVGAAESATNRSIEIYQNILRQTGDEEAADALYLTLQLEEGQRVLDQVIAETTVPVKRAQLQQARVGLEEVIRAKRDQLEATAKTTPERFTRTVDPLGAKNRKALQGELGKLDDMAFKLGMKGIDISADLEKADMDAQGKAAERQEERLRGEGGIYREASALAGRISEKEGVIRQVEEILAMDEMPGVGGFAMTEKLIAAKEGLTGTNPAHAFRKRVENVIERGLRDATGANAPPEEVAKYVDLVFEGATDINGEERIRENLRAFNNGLRATVDGYRRGVSPEALEYYTRNELNPEADPITLGLAPAEDVVRRK